jgi:hypothetical protein
MLGQLEGDEKSKYTKIVVAALALGVVVALAGPVIAWLSGVNPMDPTPCSSSATATGSTACLPPQLANLMKNSMTLLIFVGAFIAAIGVILGVMKL